MNSYCRTRSAPHGYFQATGYVNDLDNPDALWILREVGKARVTIYPNQKYVEEFEPCCPAEAVWSLQK
jgi:hypothetical protein